MTTRKYGLLGLMLGMTALAACDGKTDPADIIVNPPPTTRDTIYTLNLVPEVLNLTTGSAGTLVAVVTATFGSPSQAVTCTASNTLVTVAAAANGCTVTAGATAGTSVVRATSTVAPGASDASTVVISPASTTQPVTISIASVTQGGTNNPVNPLNTSGIVDVTLNVDIPTGRTDVNRVEVLIDNREACRQTLTATGDISVDAAELVQIICSINTAAFDSITGVPTNVNGSRTIRGRVVLNNGTEAATATTTLILNNPSFVIARTTWNTPGTTTAKVPQCTTAGTEPRSIGGPGSLWCGGDLRVSLLPVIFGAPATDNLQSATVSFSTSGVGANGTARCDSAAGQNSGMVAPEDGAAGTLEDGSARTTVVAAGFPAVNTDQNGNGFLDFPGCGPITVTKTANAANSWTVDFLTATDPDDATSGIQDVEDMAMLMVTSVSVGGQVGPACVYLNRMDVANNPLNSCGVVGGTSPANVAYSANALRVDNNAPRVIEFDVNPATCTSTTCYFNGAFSFSARTGFFQSRDYGSDTQTAAFQAGTSSTTLGTVTTGNDLPETVTSNDLIVRATVTDAVGNSRSVYPDDSGVSTVVATSSGDAQPFGIDKTRPQFVTVSTPPNTGANDGTNYTFTYIDSGVGPSGFGTTPVYVRVQRTNVGGSVSCHNPGTGAQNGGGSNGCSTNGGYVATAGTFNVGATTTNGYYAVSYFLRDAANNSTDTVTVTTLLDGGAAASVPSAGAITGPSVITGNTSTAFSSSVTDNLDLGDVQPVIQYAALMEIEEALAGVGTYNTPLTTSTTATATIANFIRSIEDGLGGAITRANAAAFLLRDVSGVVDNAQCPIPLANGGAQQGSTTGTVAGTATTPWPTRTAVPTGNCFVRLDDISNAVSAGIPTSTTSASRERSLAFTGITGFTAASSNAAGVCSDRTSTGAGQPCPTNPTTTVLTASAQGPTATLGNPFVRVNFYYRDMATNRSVLIGTSVAPTVTDDGAVPSVRTYAWSFTWNPGNLPAGAYTVEALGVHSTGMALRATVVQTLTVD